MKLKSCLILSILAMYIAVTGQNVLKLPAGFPDRSPNLDVLPGFRHPPKGYGEVPFYWWIGRYTNTGSHPLAVGPTKRQRDHRITDQLLSYRQGGSKLRVGPIQASRRSSAINGGNCFNGF